MKLIFEKSVPGRRCTILPACDVESVSLPASLRRETKPLLPEMSETDISRHYTELCKQVHGVNCGFYPLGSCTMKYNPRIDEEMAALPGFANVHPLSPVEDLDGMQQVLDTAAQYLCEITGMDGMTFQPAAGAHGEFTGVLLIKQYHDARGDRKRTKIIVPDSAHGTNPASAAVCGLKVVEVKSLDDGTIDIDALRPLLDDTVAGIMMTNPNTLGLFETRIPEIAEMVHACGGLLYYDGANFNPLLGKVRPGDMGFDIMHLNLHKTFSTPHGGGGPGSGPVGVAAHLAECLPDLKVSRGDDGLLHTVRTPEAAGRISGFMGNFGVLMRAYAYILMLGKQNIRMAGPLATLNANYIKESLKDCYKLPIPSVCKHEFVFDGLADKSTGITTLDIAKRLLDYGFHAPTIYFPLLFHQAIMIEPTETESKETIDEFIDVMRRIAKEAVEKPEALREAPLSTPVLRLDETTAAKHPILTFKELQQC